MTDLDSPNAAIVDVCREAPDETQVCVRINQNDWQWISGSEFLELWDQPFAGTITVDRAVRTPA